MIATTLSPVEVLQRNGLEIRPWQAASFIAELTGRPVRSDLRMFSRGTVHGLLELKPDGINVIAFGNEKRNNGQFEGVVSRLERSADELAVPLRVVEFWNKRLRDWFGRRGYSLGKRPGWGSFAERPVKGDAP